MSTILMVPVHLDALRLKQAKAVVEPMADFSLLPYTDGIQDHNPDIANISEDIASKPFQSQNLWLKPGIHLHWSLPDALTKRFYSEDGAEFPTVPNRWLITRRSREKSENNYKEKQWVVESDYLYPPGDAENTGSVCVPVLADDFDGKTQPFRYMGRKLPVDEWKHNSKGDEYFSPLTAIGYGEPTFAAFYPNCLSVFGLFDDDYINDIPEYLQYEIIGWYSNDKMDYLNESIIEFLNESCEKPPPDDSIVPQTLKETIEEKFKWTWKTNEDVLPKDINSLCFGRLTLNGHENKSNNTLTKQLIELNTIKKQYVAEKNRLEKQVQALKNRKSDLTKQIRDITPLEIKNVNPTKKLLDKYSKSKTPKNYEKRQMLVNQQAEIIEEINNLQVDLSKLNKKIDEISTQIELVKEDQSYSNKKDSKQEQHNKKIPTSIAIGNTGTEALSAWLSHEIDFKQQTEIEDQLESLYFEHKLENRILDIGPKFKEARHENGFRPISCGYVWAINQAIKKAPPESSTSQEAIETTLPEEIALHLNDLNILQKQYNNIALEIESRRKQIFSDWYKHMLCKYPPQGNREDYPDIDETRCFLEYEINSLNQLINKNGVLIPATDSNGKTTGFKDCIPDSTAEDIKNKFEELTELITKYSKKDKTDESVEFVLKQTSAPRYWQPNDPVILICGDDAKPTERHGQDGRLRADGLLECYLVENSSIQYPLTKKDFSPIRTEIEKIEKDNPDNNIAFRVWEKQTWNPILLEWEVEVFPLRRGNYLSSRSWTYDENFIKDNYALKENKPDLEQKSAYGKDALIQAANVYSGSSILTNQSGIKLKHQIEYYLEKQLLHKYCRGKNISESDLDEKYFELNKTQVFDWYCKKSQTQKDDPLRNIIKAYEKLTSDDFYCLAQSLGGFNEALLMHKQTMQLEVDDPLAFSEYDEFTKSVRDAVEDCISSSPEPLTDFNPIRTGALNINRLRLVDTFGQTKNLDAKNIRTTETMSINNDAYTAALPPRIVQPARINFQWLSSNHRKLEMNSHPATTPICGWMLPNNLDGSVMIYDNKGSALGAITTKQDDPWQPAPGQAEPITNEKIPNLFLCKVVGFIIDKQKESLKRKGKTFLEKFLLTLDTSLEHINPESFAQHQHLSVLIGRPIAVVGASIKMELSGLPTANQGWNVFRKDMTRDKRETNSFTGIKFPVRIGEYRQFNDGVIGYWAGHWKDREKEEDFEINSPLYVPQSDDGSNSDDDIEFHDDMKPLNMFLSLDQEPQTLVMLLDPISKVHITTGVLPTKVIDIPPDQYIKALQSIEVTFFSAPIITEDSKINLPLPVEAGYQWSWLEKDRAIEKDVVNNELNVKEVKVGPVSTKALFPGQQSIKEGWLKLNKVDSAKTSN